MYNTIQRGNQNTTKGKIHTFVVLYSLVPLLIFCLSPFVFAGVKKDQKRKEEGDGSGGRGGSGGPACSHLDYLNATLHRMCEAEWWCVMLWWLLPKEWKTIVSRGHVCRRIRPLILIPMLNKVNGFRLLKNLGVGSAENLPVRSTLGWISCKTWFHGQSFEIVTACNGMF